MSQKLFRMATKICDMEIKDTCLNKLCSKFEVDITKN